MTRAPDPTLKCVVVSATAAAIVEEVERVLRETVAVNEIRRFSGSAFLVHTAATPADIRDSLAGALAEADSALVVEFERWSGRGPGIDSSWLLRRGH